MVVSALGEPAEIWMNDSPAKHHWLELKLVGAASNRDGIGATIKVTSKHLSQYNHVTTAPGNLDGVGNSWRCRFDSF